MAGRERGDQLLRGQGQRAAHVGGGRSGRAGGRAVAGRAGRFVRDRDGGVRPPHIVVANAGMEVAGQPAAEITEEQFDRLFAVNAEGAFFPLQKAARLVADGGRLVYIGSSTAVSPRPGTGLCPSSKSVALNLVRVLALELGPRDITVNSILPTATAGADVVTDVVGGDELPPANARLRPTGGRAGTPGDVADAAEYLAGDLVGRISGQSLLVARASVPAHPDHIRGQRRSAHPRIDSPWMTPAAWATVTTGTTL
ncbi:SDR family NAD(P)-dependent oxidoreductase [Marinitenerispora sediminis]|uniref:SDR family NAD(P)-dependent oxidoreductase n=1 Tax=Marinitenerispora sediminis TaxID=1931232 RepID=UPI0021631C0D|nr:SDR family oxidoreductase [Marinitenerispora sediminis]